MQILAKYYKEVQHRNKIATVSQRRTFHMASTMLLFIIIIILHKKKQQNPKRALEDGGRSGKCCRAPGY